MKILYVIRSFYPAQLGGPNNTVYWMAKELVEKGYDVTVVALTDGLSEKNIRDHDIQFNQENVINGINVYYFEYIKSTYFSPKLFLWLFKHIKDYDLILLNSYFHPISWYVAILSNRYKLSFSMAPRGELEDNALVYSSKRKKFMHYVLLKRIYKLAAFFLVTSKQEMSFSKKFFPDMKYEIIPNYITVEKTELSSEDITNKDIILYLGRIHPKKGIENLIEAYSMLEDRVAQRHPLVVAGFGNTEYVNGLMKQAETSRNANYIKFVGKKTGDEKDVLYKRAKMFILPSNSENFGNVVLEALTSSTPVITSIYTPWEEIDQYCGYWIDNTPNKIFEKIQKVLNMGDEEYVILAKNAKKFVNDKYDIANNVLKVANIFEKYAKNKESR